MIILLLYSENNTDYEETLVWKIKRDLLKNKYKNRDTNKQQ